MATNIKLLDENALSAIKTYVDTQVGQAGKVDDVKLGSTSVVSNKVATIAVDGTYNSNSNKVATQTTVSNAIGALDVSEFKLTSTNSSTNIITLKGIKETDGKISVGTDDVTFYNTTGTANLASATATAAAQTEINKLDVSDISGFGAGKTLATLTETDGKIAATFQDIQLASTAKVTGLDTALAGKVPTSRTIAGLALSGDITSASLITALGLQQAMSYIGAATTTKPSAGQYVQTVIGGTTYYVSLTSSGTATQVDATKGQILTVGYKEYICTTAGASGTNVFSEMGDESSYALKTISISAGSGLTGGGSLAANRTINHATPTGAATKSSGFYKFSTDSFGHVNGTTAVAKADLTGLGVADNSTVVHLTGAETISGKKTFSHADGIAISNAGATATLSVTNNSESGELNIGGVGYLSANLTASFGAVTATGLETKYFGDSDFRSDVFVPKNYVIKTAADSDGADASYGIKIPDTRGYTADRTLATTADIPSVSDFVTKSTAQTISGKKTFTGGLLVDVLHVGEAASTGWKVGLTTDSGDEYPYFVVYQNNSSKGCIYLPTATSTDKTIATTDQIPSVSDFVKGPSSATDNAIAVYNGTGGKTIKNSGLIVDSAVIKYTNSGTTYGRVDLTLTSTGIQSSVGGIEFYTGSSSGNAAAVMPAKINNGSRVYTDNELSLGASSYRFKNLYLSGNLSDGTNSTTISAIKSHLDNTTVHITSAERTSWNAKISAVKSLKTDATATQSTSSSEALSGSGTVTLHRISKTGKLSHLLSDDGGSVSVITTAEINAILYPSA